MVRPHSGETRQY